MDGKEEQRVKDAYFTVGIVANTHALRGEVKVLSRTDFADVRFKSGSKLFLRSSGQSPIRELVVKSARAHKNLWILGFEGIGSIADVENWKGMELCVHESQLQTLPEGSYYVHELVGLKVVTDDGREVGELVEVLAPGANDVYVVRGHLQQRDVLVPAIPDCILNVDLSARVMRVHLLPGLLEDDAEA